MQVVKQYRLQKAISDQEYYRVVEEVTYDTSQVTDVALSPIEVAEYKKKYQSAKVFDLKITVGKYYLIFSDKEEALDMLESLKVKEAMRHLRWETIVT